MNPAPISVITPTYNGAHWAQQMLGSILTQTCLPAEVVIVDDCSSVGDIRTAIEPFESLLTIRLLRNASRIGPGRSRSVGLREASQRFIAPVDIDDILLPHHLETLLAVQQRASGSVIASPRLISWLPPDGYRVSGPPKRVPESASALLGRLARSNFIPGPSMFDRQLALDCGGYGESQRGEDFHLWLRLVAAGVGLEFARVPSYIYRTSGVGEVQNSSDTKALLRDGMGVVRSMRVELKAAGKLTKVDSSKLIYGQLSWLLRSAAAKPSTPKASSSPKAHRRYER